MSQSGDVLRFEHPRRRLQHPSSFQTKKLAQGHDLSPSSTPCFSSASRPLCCLFYISPPTILRSSRSYSVVQRFQGRGCRSLNLLPAVASVLLCPTSKLHRQAHRWNESCILGDSHRHGGNRAQHVSSVCHSRVRTRHFIRSERNSGVYDSRAPLHVLRRPNNTVLIGLSHPGHHWQYSNVRRESPPNASLVSFRGEGGISQTILTSAESCNAETQPPLQPKQRTVAPIAELGTPLILTPSSSLAACLASRKPTASIVPARLPPGEEWTPLEMPALVTVRGREEGFSTEIVYRCRVWTRHRHRTFTSSWRGPFLSPF